MPRSLTVYRFHPLQTGTHIERFLVSINAGSAGTKEQVFRFPSNGKPHRKWTDYPKKAFWFVVSIPFIRERALQVRKDSFDTGNYRGFPFPSNGNAHRKFSHYEEIEKIRIVFPFPPNGKGHRKADNTKLTVTTPRFPFPSNGKVEHKSGQNPN